MESKEFKIIGGDIQINFEIGHTKDEWEQLYFDCWDFSIEDLLDGAIDPDPEIIYWLIDGRLYETHNTVND